jgi:hypothetical protein
MYYILSYLFKNDKPNTIFTVFFSSFDNKLCDNNYKKYINVEDDIIFEFENQIIKTNVENIEFISEDEHKNYTYKVEFTIPYDFLKNKIGRFSISILGKYQKIQLMPSNDSIFLGNGWEIFKFEEPSEKIANNGRWEIIDNIYKISITNDLVKENYITIFGAGFEKECKINLINNDTQAIINPQWCLCSATKIIFSISKNTVQYLESGLYDIRIENPSGTNAIKNNPFKIMIAPEIEISNSISSDKIILLGEEQSLYISGEHFSDGKNNRYVNIQFDFFLNGFKERQKYILTNEINPEKSNMYTTNICYDPELLFINEKLLCINIKKNNTSRKGINGQKLSPDNIKNASIYDIINNINLQEINITIISYTPNNIVSSFPVPLYAIFNIVDITNVSNTNIFDIVSPKMIIKPSISQYEEPFVKEYNVVVNEYYGSDNSIPITKYFYKNYEDKYAVAYIDVIFKIKIENDIHTFVIPHNSTEYNTYCSDISNTIQYENGELPAYNSLFIDYIFTKKNIEYYPRTTDTSEYGLNSFLTNADNMKSSFTYKGQINELIEYIQTIKNGNEITVDIGIEFNFSSVAFSSRSNKNQNTISHIKNDAKILSNFVSVPFVNKNIKNNIELFKENIITIGTAAAYDFVSNDYYFSNNKNGFFQKNNTSKKSILKIILFAYYALICASNNQLYTIKILKHFHNSMSAFLNGEIETINIREVPLTPNYVLSINDISKIIDHKYEFVPPFCENDKPKTYITHELRSDIIKSMVMILRNCENMQELNNLLKPNKMSDDGSNFTLPATSIYSMCQHIIDSIIYYNFESECHKQIANIILQDTLVVSGADATFTFAQQIPDEKEYYMLIPYPDIINAETDIPSNLSYMDYGAPILKLINGLLKLQNNKCIINPITNEYIYYKEELEKIMNEWITKTIFLLISDSGKYKGTETNAAPSELYRHYLQTIHSSLIGNPFANIINNIEAIKTNIEEGKQENAVPTRLGKQLIENIIDNHDNIGNAVLKSDTSRTEDKERPLFQKGDMLTIFVSISGSIGTMPVAINNIFARCIDPTINNSGSFKEYIINNKGDHIKPIIYAIMVPLIDDFIE